jgi:uncharacterized integral membrane protein
MANNKSSDLGSRLKLIAMAIALGVLILFIALNFDEVEVNLLVAQMDMRLAFALILSGLLGFIAGYFAPRRR